MPWLILLTVAGALVVGVALVPLSRSLAARLGAMDVPGHRKIHDRPMARLGGIALFGSFASIVLLGYLLVPVLHGSALAQGLFGDALRLLHEAPRVESKLLAVLTGAAIAFVVGLLDDIYQARFPTWLKAAGQLLAALVVVLADVRTSFMPWEWLNLPVTLLWLVGMTNAFNLLDNLDGASAGVACVAACVLLLNAWLLGEFFISLALAAFVGSLLAFLIFNFHPASVFMGDCGSLFIGSVLGSLTLLERYVGHASSSLFPVLMPVLVLAVPIIDTTTVVAIRVRERRPIYLGDTRHLAHRLLSLGFSPRAAALFLYLATACLGLGAALLPHASVFESVVILAQASGFVALFLTLLFFERRKVPR